MGIGRLSKRSTRASVAGHAATTNHMHLGGTLPRDADTDVAGDTTVVTEESPSRSVNSPELARHRDADGDFPAADSSGSWDTDVCLVVSNPPR